MKQIFFVRNSQVWEDISKQIDRNSVAAVYNLDLFEKIPGNTLPDEIPINDLDRFKNDVGGGYHAVIAVNTGAPKDNTQFSLSYFFRLSLALARTLQKNDIPFSFWRPFSPYIHLYGTFPNLSCDFSSIAGRDNPTLGLIGEAFKIFPQDFVGKKINMWIAMGDDCLDALNLAIALDLPHAFAYYTSYAMKDRVIAFPDYDSRYKEEDLPNDRCSNDKCRAAAEKPWQDNRVFWRGSLFTSFSRYCLFELGKKYPQYLIVEELQKSYLPTMEDQAKYKYLIDTRGNAWSCRLQTLLKLGRVVFIADRPYRDWYFDKMRPMEHYVPVKEDMSDLIEKYCYMERHPELYDKIVSNLREFVEENLMPRRIVFEAKEIILRYGVVK